MTDTLICPCDTGLPYNQCCGLYHTGGQPAPDALALMRSRYAALALGAKQPALVDYLTQTIHRNSPYFNPNLKRHRAFWQQYCQQTEALGLTIVGSQLNDTEAWVQFKASLLQQGKPHTVEERSRFIKLNRRWLYLDGQFINP